MNDGKWWDKSITLVEGCSPISDGCKNCWSASMAQRFHQKKGLTTDGHYNGKIIYREDRLKELMRREPTRWTIWNDLFHKEVPFEFVLKIFGLSMATPWHTYMILTKRIDRVSLFFKWWREQWRESRILWGLQALALQAIENLSTDLEKADQHWKDNFDQSGRGKLDYSVPWPHPNIHLGVTVCNPVEKWKINVLRTIPAAHRFVCFEPLLHNMGKLNLEGIDWVIGGCESLGGRAGRFQEGYPEAARSIIEQCKAAGVPVWHKQMPIGNRVSKDLAEWPVEFRVQEYE